MQSIKTIILATAVAVSGFSASTAHACQGPQFETHYVMVHPNTLADIPDGKVQLKIRLTDYGAKANANRRDYFRAKLVNDEKRKQFITVPIPPLTSCGRLNLPQSGEYYIIGEYAKGAGDGPLYIGGGQVFVARYLTRKRGLFGVTPE